MFRHANLNHIRFSAAVPPTVTGEGPLYNMGRLDSIVVPCGSLEAWLADSYWGQFADKYKEDCNGIAGIQDDGISVYPNPARGRMVVSVTDNCCHLELVNMLGVTVLSQKVAGSSIEIDVSRLARGTYLLRLHSADGIATKRLIVQ